MLTVAAPDPLNGKTLRAELADAGIDVDRDDVTLAGDVLRFATLDETDRTAVEAVLAAHTGEPSPEDVERADRHDQLEALRAKALGVWRGNDTFTVPQVQRVLAGLVLRELGE